MNPPECAVKGCKNVALILYGSKFICGECYIRIAERIKERQNKEVEELEQ